MKNFMEHNLLAEYYIWNIFNFLGCQLAVNLQQPCIVFKARRNRCGLLLSASLSQFWYSMVVTQTNTNQSGPCFDSERTIEIVTSVDAHINGKHGFFVETHCRPIERKRGAFNSICALDAVRLLHVFSKNDFCDTFVVRP